METYAVPSFTISEGDTIWQWFLDLPLFVKRNMSRSEQDKQAFIASFRDSVKILVYDGGSLLGFVECRPRGDGIFEAHLFCPRHTPFNKLADAISSFFETCKTASYVIRTLLFYVRVTQRNLQKCLYAEGCKPSGWRYLYCGEHFDCLVWNNTVL